MTEEEVVFVMDRFGYCKTLDRASYDRNREQIDSEYRCVLPLMNTSKVLIFTDRGTLHQVKVPDIPAGKPKDKGTPIDNISKFEGQREEILYIASPETIRGKKLLFVTRQAYLKQVSAEEFETVNKTVMATKLAEDDLLLAVKRIDDEAADAVLLTDAEFTLRFPLDEIPEMKKNSRGVRGMKLGATDLLAAVCLLNEENSTEFRGKSIALSRLKQAHRD